MFSFDIQRYAGSIALISNEMQTTYHDLYNEEQELWSNINERCLVFILCTNAVPSVVGYISCINHNVVPALIDASLDKTMLLGLYEQYKPKFLWLPADKEDLFGNCTAVYRKDGYVLLTTGNSDVEMNPDLALLMTTSGSTGSPKFVRQSYENLRSNTDSIVEYLKITSEDRAITNLPMYYVYGLSIINTHLAAGASIVITESSFLQRDFWQLVKQNKVTNFNWVPYTYEVMKKSRIERMDLPSLRLFTQAGGKLAPELHEHFARYAELQGKEFVVMYGAAEATSRMGYLPAEMSLEKAGFMGDAIPGGRFELWDETGNVIDASGVEGELVYYGENVAMGYAERRDDLAKGDENGGRLQTGDIALRDDSGYYKVVGRKKRFLKLFGKRTNLQEVEHLLKVHFESEIACGGVDDKLYAFYVDASLGAEIVPFLSEKLGVHFSAFKAMQVIEIPKNESGKTQYKELEKYYDL